MHPPFLCRLVVWALCGALLISSAYGLAANYDRSLANVLVSEGGNDDDPRDPGGRTSRGIIQREWSVWRQTHPGLPADVWQAPQDQIKAIYHEEYWAHPCVRGDALPAGLDYTIFDYGVNSGVGRAGKVLRRVLNLSDTTCVIGDDVLAAVKARGKYELITEVNRERLRFLRGLRTWPVFGGGWTRRVESVRVISLRMTQPMSARGMSVQPAYGPGKGFEEDEVQP